MLGKEVSVHAYRNNEGIQKVIVQKIGERLKRAEEKTKENKGKII